MWCRKDISEDFIKDNSTQKYYNEYFSFQVGIMVEQRKMRLTDVQDQANQIMRSRRFEVFFTGNRHKLLDLGHNMDVIKLELLASYDTLGIAKTNPFKRKDSKIGWLHWNSWLFSKHCVICDANCNTIVYPMVYECYECKSRYCKTCVKLAMVINDSQCLSCNSPQDLSNSPGIFSKSFLPKIGAKKYKEFKPKILEILGKKFEKLVEYKELCLVFYRESAGIEWTPGTHQEQKSVKTEPVFKVVRRCLDETCKGYLNNWKCGLCDKYFCAECHVQKNARVDEDHVCKDDDKATVAMLKAESKPCPQCGTPIYKNGGCDQIWTPCCRIAFSWRTGELEKGRIHSPEYYDFMRRTNNGVVPREREDNADNGCIEVDYNSLRYSLRGIKLNWDMYHQLFEHVRAETPRLPENTNAVPDGDLALKYLTDDITEENWKKELKKRIKTTRKQVEIRQIYDMFIMSATFLFQTLVQSRDSEKFKNDYKELYIYVNQHIQKIKDRYKSKEQKYFLRNSILDGLIKKDSEVA